MSIRAMNWAWAQEIPPTPKLILMALADAANHADECWPGIPFVAEKCCVSERTVQRVLREFEATRLLSVRERFTAKGRRTSNVYRLHIGGETSPDKLSPSKATAQEHGVNLSGTGVTSYVTVDGDKPVSPPEPPKESEQQPLQFPQRLSTAEKLAIAEQLAALPSTDAQAMLDELADAMATATIKTNPLRWFSGLVRKQKSGAFVPAGGIRIAERRKQQPREQDFLAHENAAPKTDSAIARASLQQMKLLIRTPARTAGADGHEQD
jgi:hypothetical protein